MSRRLSQRRKAKKLNPLEQTLLKFRAAIQQICNVYAAHTVPPEKYHIKNSTDLLRYGKIPSHLIIQPLVVATGIPSN